MKNHDKRIVIFGGAFSPPHLGHVIAIDALVRLFPCDEIWVMPSADRQDKIISVSGEHQQQMLAIVINDLFPQPHVPIIISSWELDLPSLTTTYKTKLELNKKYPDYEFYFLVGSDIAGDIKDKWIDGAKLWQSANFIVIKKFGHVLPEKLPPKVTILDDGAVGANISSTFVRKLIAEGHSGVPYILPNVAEYIRDNGLYKILN
ncbi:MAG: nicotinate-nicotinamide nucleotide adenylyltransferase [bacterium]|nr:nicotinate-nicotinamide nucleotide adenylyltransferase [bacterium]